jgi:hypothetical protein
VRAAAIHDSAHGEFWLKGRPNLSNENKIERGMERLGDLGRDDHSAPRQGENDRLVLLMMSKLSGKSPASVASIPVDHDRLPF